MKQLSMYQTEQEINLDYTSTESLRHVPLTELQMSKIGFVELYEDCLYTTNVENYSIFKVRHTKRKPVKQETIEYEYNNRIKKLAKQELSFDMDVVLQEVEDDLIRMSEQSSKDILVVFDHVNKRFMIDAPRTAAEDVLHFMKKIIVNEEYQFELVTSDPAMMQKLMTGYVLKEDTMPEPFVLGEYTELGLPAVIGGKPKTSKVIIKDEHSSCDEVKKHLLNNKLINKLELDADGVVFFNIDSTFMITKLAFEESLAYDENPELSLEENLLAHWNVIFPELSKDVNILLRELGKLEEEED